MDSSEAASCPVCACALEAAQELTRCPACDTPHHADCWSYNGGCAIYACQGQTALVARHDLAEAAGLDPADPRFTFTGDRDYGGMGQVEARVAALVLVAAAGVAVASWSGSPVLGAVAFVASYFLSLLIRDRLRVDVPGGCLERTLYLAPFALWRSRRPLADVATLSLRPAFGEAGWTHRKLVRAQVRWRDGSSQGMAFDLQEAGIDEAEVARWAQALGRAAGVQVVRAPVPHRQVLLKRLRAFESYLAEGRPLSSPWLLPWRLRWLLVPGIPFLAGLDLPGALTVALVLPAVSLFFTFVTPSSVLSTFGEPERLDPYPDPGSQADEAESLTKVDGFLTMVEGKRFVSLAAGWFRPLFSGLLVLLATLGPLALVPGGAAWWLPDAGVLGWLAVVLVGMVGGELTRAEWEDAWTRGWLASSRTALEIAGRREEETAARSALAGAPEGGTVYTVDAEPAGDPPEEPEP